MDSESHVDLDGDLRRFGFQLFKKRLVTCLGPGDCEKPAIQAHSLQRARALDRIAVDGHVLQFVPNLSGEGSLVQLKRLGVRQASTFPGMCASHDVELFRSIETQEIDGANDAQLFALAYRATVKELHACMEAGSRLQYAYQKLASVGRVKPDEPSMPGAVAVDRMIIAYDTHLYKTRLDVALERQELDALRHATVVYEGLQPTVAVSALFSLDESAAFGETPRLILNVVPQAGHVLVVFSWHRDEANAAEGWLQEWSSAQGYFQRYLLSKAIIQKCSNFFLAPVFYEDLTSEKRSVIENYFRCTILEDRPDYDHPLLYLFSDL